MAIPSNYWNRFLDESNNYISVFLINYILILKITIFYIISVMNKVIVLEIRFMFSYIYFTKRSLG